MYFGLNSPLRHTRLYTLRSHAGDLGARAESELPSTNVDDCVGRYGDAVDVEASARKLGVRDEDMLHALRHHWRASQTDVRP